MPELILFTDLDGTLLDHDSYCVRAALPAIDLLVRRGQPIIPVSSKTASEIRHWNRMLTLKGPFICENGCGIILPAGSLNQKPHMAVEENGEWRISLGKRVEEVQAALEALSADAKFQYRSLAEMTPDELSSLTGLAGEELDQCMDREYDAPFVITGHHDGAAVAKMAADRGYHFTRGGRFYHLTGGCHKGDAVRILVDLYRSERPDILCVAIGDSLNDLPMFREVDMAFLVQKPDGTYDTDIPTDAARRVKGKGPAGWRAAVEEVMTLE